MHSREMNLCYQTQKVEVRQGGSGKKKLETYRSSVLCFYSLTLFRVTAKSINKLVPVSVFLKSKITSRCSPQSLSDIPRIKSQSLWLLVVSIMETLHSYRTDIKSTRKWKLKFGDSSYGSRSVTDVSVPALLSTSLQISALVCGCVWCWLLPGRVWRGPELRKVWAEGADPSGGCRRWAEARLWCNRHQATASTHPPPPSAHTHTTLTFSGKTLKQRSFAPVFPPTEVFIVHCWSRTDGFNLPSGSWRCCCGGWTFPACVKFYTLDSIWSVGIHDWINNGVKM